MEKGDLISREALRMQFAKECHGECVVCVERCQESGECMLIVAAPTVDAVPVVRCKDCMHRYSARCPMCVKTVKGVIIWEATTDDGFCHKGLAEEELHACHECGEIWSEKDEPKWDGVTCPACGAKMDGLEESL